MMADEIQFSIIGVDPLVEKLKNVTTDMRYRTGRSALRKAAQRLVEIAKQNAQGLDDPDTGRSIADNIALRWNGRLWKNTGDLGFRVGVMKGAVLPQRGESVDKRHGAKTPHWRLLEFGTKVSPARPFLRPALANNTQEITNVFVDFYRKRLDSAIKRAGK